MKGGERQVNCADPVLISVPYRQDMTHVLNALACFAVTISAVGHCQTPWTSTPFSIPNAPAPHDLIDQADRAALVAAQAERTTNQCAEISRMGLATYKGLFKNAGPLTPAEFERAKEVLSPVSSILRGIALQLKFDYARLRPVASNFGIEPCHGAEIEGSSYPSAHVLAAYALGCVLKEIFPAKAERFDAYAERVGQLQIQAGVNYPSDVKAGAELGRLICERLKADPHYASQLRAVNAD